MSTEGFLSKLPKDWEMGDYFPWAVRRNLPIGLWAQVKWKGTDGDRWVPTFWNFGHEQQAEAKERSLSEAVACCEEQIAAAIERREKRRVRRRKP